MGAGHAHALYVHEHTTLHHLAPEVKIACALGMVVTVALTPREEFWAFAAYAVVLLALLRIARFTVRFVLARTAAVLPFILFAFVIPFVGGGDTVQVLGLELSREGLWGMWNILAKAFLGIIVSILLAGTTEIPSLLRGLGRLRFPAPLTAIASFMIRYLELIADELSRMRVAMTARGYDPRWLWQAKPIAASAGALFIRSYERGERVHAAMVARGYTGAMPELSHHRASTGEWLAGGAFVVLAALVGVTAVLT